MKFFLRANLAAKKYFIKFALLAIVIILMCQIATFSTFYNRLENQNGHRFLNVDSFVHIVNELGKDHDSTSLEALEFVFNYLNNGHDQGLSGNSEMARQALVNFMDLQRQQRTSAESGKTKITIASISCGNGDGDRYMQLRTMLKSAVVFSQDAALHVIVFVDEDSIMAVAQILLEFKWTTKALGQHLTFEIHMEWFPSQPDDIPMTVANDRAHSRSTVNWKGMYAKCATQRLFFPKLLPHIDSLIYLDTDILILSNLTELWSTFGRKMKDGQLAALAANNELTSSGFYDWGHVPHFGEKGLNAGVMLMNLTAMREFGFQDKSIATQELYRENIRLADQDIINIIASIFPDKFLQLDCSYNFNWVHCGYKKLKCYEKFNSTHSNNFCFCGAAKHQGVKILHGNGKTFYSDYYQLLFLPQAYEAFQRINLLTDPKNYVLTIQDLKKQFNALPVRPCHPLTADVLYGSAEKYLQDLNAS